MSIIDEAPDPSGWSWQHYSLRFAHEPPPWTSASQDQMEAVRDLQRLGFECAAMTTLADGSLFLMFKRAKAPEQEQPQIEDRPGLSTGLYL